MGREVLPDGILYASRESHYSVFKAARMYRMDAIKVGGGLGERAGRKEGRKGGREGRKEGGRNQQNIIINFRIKSLQKKRPPNNIFSICKGGTP